MAQQISQAEDGRQGSKQKERLRGKYKFFVELLHTSMEGANMELLRRSLGCKDYAARVYTNRLVAAGLLRHEGSTYTTTDSGKEFASAARRAVAILDSKYSAAEIPGMIDEIRIKAPSRPSSVYDYSPVAEREAREETRDMMHRSRLQMVRAILGAMVSRDVIESDIRKAARFEFNPKGKRELDQYVSLLVNNGMIKRYPGTDAFHITDTGVRFKKALDCITEVIGS